MVIVVDSRLLCLIFEYHPYCLYHTDGGTLSTGPKHSPLSIITQTWQHGQTSMGRANEGIDLLFLGIASLSPYLQLHKVQYQFCTTAAY